jgi:hypothetical protein
VAPSPDRPFVPHRTPKTPRPVVGSTEFRLARPFVAGAEHESVETFRAEAAEAVRLESAANRPEPAEAVRAESAASLQPIDDFLHRPVQSALPVAQESSVENFPSEFDEESYDLPPVEHFLDPLPRVGDFAPETSSPFDETPAPGHEDFAPSEPVSGSLAAEWASTDWQQYDWRSLAALGEGGESAATNDWATTDWDASGPRSERAASERTAQDGRPTAAQAIAAALDQIAQRIRSGELAVPAGATDPATLAATLAAILGTRT